MQRGDSKMNRHDQQLLEKQLGVSYRPPQNGITMQTGITTVFLAGMGIGDIVSNKTKRANTDYAALISFPNGQE